MSDDAKNLLTDPHLRDAPSIEGFKVLDPAVLYRKVGRGGMGTVYRGRHFSLECDVAIKVLKADLAQDRAFVGRFEREARLAAQINHQNVVRVMDVKHRKGVHYLVMEFVSGETARERVARKGPLSEREALSILAGAATGLAEAHAKNIIHRDIKPDNILISANGDVKLADLGLAKANQANVENSLSMLASGIMGTPQYMPPEQWRTPDVKPSADIWALGAMLYFLLAGRSAIPAGELLVVADRIRDHEFPSLADLRSDLSPEIVELCAKMTRRNPEERFQNARELMRRVRPMVAHEDCDEVLADSATGTGIVRAAQVTPPPRATLAKIRLRVASEMIDLEAEQARGAAEQASSDAAIAEEPMSDETRIHTTPLPPSLASIASSELSTDSSVAPPSDASMPQHPDAAQPPAAQPPAAQPPAAQPSAAPRQVARKPAAAAPSARPMTPARAAPNRQVLIGAGAVVLLLVVAMFSGLFGGAEPEKDPGKSTASRDGESSPKGPGNQVKEDDSGPASPTAGTAGTSTEPRSGAAANANDNVVKQPSSAKPAAVDPEAEAAALVEYQKGMAALPKVGQLQVAIDALEKALQLDANLDDARTNLALALTTQCRQKESDDPGLAYASAMRVLELVPGDAAMSAASNRLRTLLQKRLLDGLKVTSPQEGAVFDDPAVRVQGRMVASDFAAIRMSMDARADAGSQPFLRADAQPVQVVAGTFATVLEPPGNGKVWLRVEAEDSNGVIAELPPIQVVINTVAPVLTVAVPKDGAMVAATLTMRGTINHPTPATLRIGEADVPVEADGTWEHTLDLGNGEQEIVVVARDGAERETSKTLKVTVDREPPQLELLTELPAVTKKAAVHVSGRVVDPGKATLVLRDTDVPIKKGGSFATDLQLAEDGRHEFVLVARDAVGNEAKKSIVLLRDTLGPVLSWVAPPEAVAAGDFEVRGTVEDVSPDPVVTVNGKPATMNGNNWRATVTVLDRESVAVVVAARDALGNEAKPLEANLVGRATLKSMPWGTPARDARAVTIGDVSYPSVVTEERTGIRMVLVLPGDYRMGSPESERGHEFDEKEHPRQIRSPFYLGETEVTQGQWMAVMSENPSQRKAPDHPVEGVRWADCRRFLDKVNRAGIRLRLPTEAEWEYACRGGTTTAFHFGDVGGERNMRFGEHPFAIGNRPDEGTAPCGSLPPNRFGLYEMHGNVWEWCADTMRRYPSKGNESAAIGTGMRVVRGGSWRSSMADCRSANRQACQDTMSLIGVGFRIAITLQT